MMDTGWTTWGYGISGTSVSANQKNILMARDKIIRSYSVIRISCIFKIVRSIRTYIQNIFKVKIVLAITNQSTLWPKMKFMKNEKLGVNKQRVTATLPRTCQININPPKVGYIFKIRHKRDNKPQ